jgi:hypothetical protein
VVDLNIKLDNYDWMAGSGRYAANWFSGLNSYSIALSHPPMNPSLFLNFNITNVNKTGGLGMIRYFDGTGEMTEFNSRTNNRSTWNVQMHCQAVGHENNNFQTEVTFFCPDQSGQSTTITNSLQFNHDALGQGNPQTTPQGVQPAERYVEMKPWEAVS